MTAAADDRASLFFISLSLLMSALALLSILILAERDVLSLSSRRGNKDSAGRSVDSEEPVDDGASAKRKSKRNESNSRLTSRPRATASGDACASFASSRAFSTHFWSPCGREMRHRSIRDRLIYRSRDSNVFSQPSPLPPPFFESKLFFLLTLSSLPLLSPPSPHLTNSSSQTARPSRSRAARSRRSASTPSSSSSESSASATSASSGACKWRCPRSDR